MQRILRKRILRDLVRNFPRYLALGLMIIFGIYIIISLIGSADTVIVRTQASDADHHVEDGRFSTFVPLKEEEIKELTEAGVTLEKLFFLDFKLEDQSSLRVFKVRQEIDQIVCDQGQEPQDQETGNRETGIRKTSGRKTDSRETGSSQTAGGEGKYSKEKDTGSEIISSDRPLPQLALEKRYCEEHHIQIGDQIRIGDLDFQVCAICTSPDYQNPIKEYGDNTSDSKNFGTAFVTDQAYQDLLESKKSSRAETYEYGYLLGGSMTDKDLKEKLKTFEFNQLDVEDPYFKDYWNENFSDLKDLKKLLRFMGAGSEEEIDDLVNVDINNLESFIIARDNPRIGAARDDVEINRVAGAVAGVILMVLFTYVISVFVIHNIEEECQVIGALYALGLKRRDLLTHYLVLPVLVTLLAGIIGTILGYSPIGLDYQLQDTYNYYSVPRLDILFEVPVLLYGMVMPPLVAAIVNYIVIRKKLNSPALALLRNEQRATRVREIDLGNMGFVARFRIRQMLRELRSVFAVLFGMFICLLVLMISLDCYVMCKNVQIENVADTRFEYMYNYKYPEKEPPEGGEACFVQSLKKSRFGYDFDISLIGINKKGKEANPYLATDISQNDFPDNECDVVISSALAQKFALEPGDDLVLKDEENDRYYAFSIKAVSQYSAGMFVYMDIDAMRDLFGVKSDYYNMVLADHALEIPAGRLASVLAKDDIRKSAHVYVSLMMSMIIVMAGASAVIFMVVMYLMMKVMIDRSAFSISLAKVFGYRKREIRRLYLNGNFYLVAAGAAVCLPLSKACMDAIYPYFISNVACAMNLHFPWYMYAGIYGAVLLLYLLISVMLTKRLNRILPAQVLKNRE